MTQLLYRHSVLFSGLFFTLVVWALWPSYFSRPLNVPSLHIHAHVLPLTLWCGLLVVQAYAIRTRQYWIHKRLGPVSYVLMGTISVTTLALFHKGMRGLRTRFLLLFVEKRASVLLQAGSLEVARITRELQRTFKNKADGECGLECTFLCKLTSKIYPSVSEWPTSRLMNRISC